jgi:ribosomal protein L11 methylase PrmA
MHPTVKPVALVADAIKDCSKRNHLVLDPFAGSGTVVIAAERTGRKARALEIDPHYVDVAVRRWEQYTGKSATLGPSSQTFEEVAEERANPMPNVSDPAAAPKAELALSIPNAVTENIMSNGGFNVQ